MSGTHGRRNLHPRMARTLALVPIVVGVMLCSYVAYAIGVIPRFARPVPGTTTPQLYYVVVVAVFVAAIPLIGYGGWLWIWWPTFRHHPRHRVVILSVTVAYLAALSLGLFLSLIPGASLRVLLSIVLGSIGCGVAVIVISRKLAAPSRAGGAIPCLRCGYDLRGQQECRCPECGAQFTVGELIIPPPSPYV